MHPVIRVFSVIITIAFLASPARETVLLVIIFSLGLLPFKEPALLHSSLKMLWRLKWLYISILVVYGWFTPGEVIVDLQEINTSYLPTVEGLQMGVLRIGVLIAIVSLISSLIQTIEKEKLVSAIIWLSAPLRIIGFNTQRFSLLLVLSLDKVLLSETTMRECLRDNKQQTGLLNSASKVIAGALANVENIANQEQIVDISISDISAPPLWQWLLPLMLATIFYLLRY